jgi:hypothetical protein
VRPVGAGVGDADENATAGNRTTKVVGHVSGNLSSASLRGAGRLVELGREAVADRHEANTRKTGEVGEHCHVDRCGEDNPTRFATGD